jgi:sulfur carrier protein ThiS
VLIFRFHFTLFKENFMPRCLLINNDGAGFADYIEVAEGTTVEKLFAQRIPHGRPADYLIRVNRQPVASDQILQEGDRVSITPTKIEGAA